MAAEETYTVVISNSVTGKSRGCGVWRLVEDAVTFAKAEAKRSRSFVAFEVWKGTPRKLIAPVAGYKYQGEV